MAQARPEPAWAASVRLLYLVATAVFLVTLGIGIPNGLDVAELSRDIVLTHVHSGTLGWITLGVVATAAWYFRAIDARLAAAAAVAIPAYVAAFATGSLVLRAVGGLVVLAIVAWLIAWVWRAWLSSDRALPGLALALGLTTFTYGSVIGVVLQVQSAAGTAWLTGDAIGAHAGAMVFSYLVLVAVGLVEWQLLGTTGLPRGGVVQLGALFLGGLILSIGLLTGNGQAAGGLYLLANLAAIALFVVRVVPRVVAVPWGAALPVRHVGVAGLWVVVAIALFLYLVAQFVAAAGDPMAISPNVLVASDHATFVGVMTNLLLGLAWTFAPDVGRPRRPASDLVLWGVNVGLVVFIVGLVADSPAVKRVGAPIMGLFILMGIAIVAVRLLRAPSLAEAGREAAPAAQA